MPWLGLRTGRATHRRDTEQEPPPVGVPGNHQLLPLHAQCGAGCTGRRAGGCRSVKRARIFRRRTVS